MPLSIKQKQVLGVTSIVVLVVVVLSVLHLVSLTRVLLEQSRHRGELIALTIYHRAQNVVVAGRFKGAINVKGRAELARGGRVDGDITSKTLVVEEGGIFQGQSIMDQQPGQSGAEQQKSAPAKEACVFASRAQLSATRARDVETAVPSSSAATRAAATGLRRVHFQARSHAPTGRAITGCPAKNRRRSSASAAALP